MGETAALAESGLNHTAVLPLNEVTAPEPETCAAPVFRAAFKHLSGSVMSRRAAQTEA
jgi:hypothetical protein